MNALLEINFWKTLAERGLEWLIASGPSILIILILAAVGWRVIGSVVKRIGAILIQRASGQEESADETEKRITTLLNIIRAAARMALSAVVLMLVLNELGVDIGPIIAGAGVIGLAVGFGAQNLVRDIISGFFMLFENQIREGDIVVINGTGGLVEKMGLRTVTLRDVSGVVHVVQNGAIESLANKTKGWSAAVFDIGVAYKEDTDQVGEIMCEVAKSLQDDAQYAAQIVSDIELFGLDQFGDSAVVMKARLKTRPGKQWEIAREYNRRLKKQFDEQGIEVPFPHQSLYFGEASEPIKIRVEGAEHAVEASSSSVQPTPN